MAELYSRHSANGLEILAFPCNDYGQQEPGGNAEVLAFAQAKGATYPVFGKISIAPGKDQSLLYNFLIDHSNNGIKGPAVKWNFEKFLFGADGGRLVKRYASKVSPLAIEADILKLLE
jgi:glutathione peroxidase